MDNQETEKELQNATPETDAAAAPDTAPTDANGKKRWFGRGIYGSKDVPIRVLDICIGIMILAAVVLTVINANFGGFTITFNTGISDQPIAAQKVMHGNVITKPEAPTRPGYTLTGWTAAEDSTELWEFSTPVENDMTLYAMWAPAEVAVKYDLVGGTVSGAETLSDGKVVYGEPYGTLPVPTKDGSTFGGWQYDGKTITEQSTVEATGEHVLTALWS